MALALVRAICTAGRVVVSAVSGALLMEAGTYLLLEDGTSKFLLE